MNEFARLFARAGLSLERLRTFVEVAEAGNIAKAAGPDPTRQSQFSRQVKELEGFFGIALTRRVGRRIEVTADGHRLAAMIRQQFRELDGFREAAAGRPAMLRLGAAGSVIHWMIAPRLRACREALGGAVLDLVQARSAEVVRGVADGRLDLGIVRRDALPARSDALPLATVGYSLFSPPGLVTPRSKHDVRRLLGSLPLAMLLPGGRFQTALDEWLTGEGIHPQVVARVSSFVAAAALVQARHAGAVLPDLAAAGLEDHAVLRLPLPWDHRRDLALLWNARGLDRAGFSDKVAILLGRALRPAAE